MGWLYCEYSKDALVRSLIASTEYDDENGKGKRVTLKHCVKGNHLWAVRQHTHTKNGISTELRYIMLYLMAKHDGMWGYKDMGQLPPPEGGGLQAYGTYDWRVDGRLAS